MAARVILLGILFTEVLRPVCPAGVRVNGVGGRNASKSESPEAAMAAAARAAGGGLALDIRPRGGELVLGRKGLTLSCAGGHEQVQWLHNGQAAPPCGDAHCKLLCNGSLKIFRKKNSIVQKRKGREGNSTLSIGWSQRNELRCIAHTSYGASLRSAPTKILIAEISHRFKEQPKDLTVEEGELARFSCSIDSVPSPPNITWLHDGEVVPTDHNNTKYAFIPPGVLFIRATKLSDAGSYRCLAVNEYLNVTRKSKEAILTVISKHRDKGSRNPVSLYPQISYTYTPIKGTNLRLACAASGYPVSMTSWMFVPRSTGVEAEQRVFLNSSSGLSILDLKNVTAADNGTYICSIVNLTKNSSNKSESQNVTVMVLIPPTLIKKPVNQVCPNGRTARFECQAEGYPTPRVYWLRNSADITINGRRSVYDKEENKRELAISATVPSDSGIYQCVAVNDAGEVWAAGRLQVNQSRNSPAAPTLLKCEARSPLKMFISWEPPKSLPSTNITAYTVHYRPVDGGKEEVSPPEPGNSTFAEITKLLKPFTNYTFYVRLWNNDGASDQSANITCSTIASVPKTAPKISVIVISSTKLNVTWKPLTKKEAQGIVTEYKLEWRISEQPSVRVRTLSADVEQYTLTDLIPGERYDLRVLARTKQGWPNVSESQLGWVTVTMPSSNDLSQSQIFIINSTAIQIKWTIKSNPIFQYTTWKINCKNEADMAVISVDLVKNSTEYTFTNLELNTSYTIELCAFNFEEKVHCITKRADLKKILTSNAPTALEATPLSASSISLTWISGNLNGSNLFEVCYYAVHFSNDTLTCIHVNSTTVIIDNLRPFTLYQFKVRSANNDTSLQNPYSETIECYTNEDVPGKVEDVEWFLVNSTKVRVAWKEPNKINGVIQNYYVAYSTDRSEPRSTWNNITVYGNKTSTSLPGLVPGKRYFVVIQAATKAGFGSPSEPIIILTGGSSSEVPSSLDEQKPLPKTKEEKQLGVILGIGISMICIIVCLCSMYCRKKYESLRSLRESAQPLKSRVLTRNGTSCCVDRSSTSVSQPAVTSNEIELAVLCPSTPLSTNPLCDTKGGQANGTIESCAKEPLLSPWEMNGVRKDVRITENPQYKPRESEDSKPPEQQEQQQQPPSHDESASLNNTQLTTVSYDLNGSDESLNNNGGCRAADVDGQPLPQKAAPAMVPVLEPNG